MNKEDFDIHEKQDLEGVEKKWKKFQEENDISKVEDVDLKHLKEEIDQLKLQILIHKKDIDDMTDKISTVKNLLKGY